MGSDRRDFHVSAKQKKKGKKERRPVKLINNPLLMIRYDTYRSRFVGRESSTGGMCSALIKKIRIRENRSCVVMRDSSWQGGVTFGTSAAALKTRRVTSVGTRWPDNFVHKERCLRATISMTNHNDKHGSTCALIALPHTNYLHGN